MKVYLSKINESWIVDRIRKEWYKNNKSISTKNISNSDIVWIISPWLWKEIPNKYLLSKKVVCSHYHFDFSNFSSNDQKDFNELDKFVDTYHVISKKTKSQLETLTNKKIITIPFWVNQNIWYEIDEKKKLRNKFGFKNEDFIVGSFQRDTEGDDLVSPKLIKGPDVFLEIIIELYKKNNNLKVLLTGKRRGYLIKNFEKFKIPFVYHEMVNLKKLNQLYNILDLYIVTSRIEGGPQAIVEAAITKTPIVSTDVGIASEILHKDSVFTKFENAKPNLETAYENASKLIIPVGFKNYIKLFEDVYLKRNL